MRQLVSKKMCPEIFDTLHIRTYAHTYVDMQILPHARMNFEVLTFNVYHKTSNTESNTPSKLTNNNRAENAQNIYLTTEQTKQRFTGSSQECIFICEFFSCDKQASDSDSDMTSENTVEPILQLTRFNFVFGDF